MLMNKQNPIRAHKATKIRYFSDRLLGGVLDLRAVRVTTAICLSDFAPVASASRVAGIPASNSAPNHLQDEGEQLQLATHGRSLSR